MGCGASKDQSAASNDGKQQQQQQQKDRSAKSTKESTKTKEPPATVESQSTANPDSTPVGADGEEDNHEEEPPPTAASRRMRSKSIAVLQSISKTRDDEEQEEDRMESLLDERPFTSPEPSGDDSDGSGSSPSRVRFADSGSDRGVKFADDSPGASPLGSPTNVEQRERRRSNAFRRGSRRRSSMAPPAGSTRRRLSSVFNEFSSQIDTFLAEQSQQNDSMSSDSTEDPAKGAQGIQFNNVDSAFGNPDDDDKLAGSGRADGSFEVPEKKEKKPLSEDTDSLRRIFDALDPGPEGITKDQLITGFEKLGYAPGNSERLEQMFVLAAKHQKTESKDILGWDAFKDFFKHLSDVHQDAGEEEDEEPDILAMSHRERTKSFMTAPLKFKNYKVTPKGSVASRVKVLAVAPQRDLFAVADRHDHACHCFGLLGAEQHRSYVGHTGSLLAVCFSPDRKYVATCSRDCFVIIWDATIGSESGRIRHPGIATAVCFSFDGKQFFTGCQDNVVRRFTTSKRRLEAVMTPLPDSHTGVIVALNAQKAFNERVVTSRSNDKGAVVLNSQTLKPEMQLTGHQGLVWQAVFGFDDSFIATNCEKEVRIWDALDGSCKYTFNSASPCPEKTLSQSTRVKLWTTVQFAPPQFGNILIACNTDGNVFLYACETGKMSLNLCFKSSVYACAVSELYPLILFGDDVGNISQLELFS